MSTILGVNAVFHDPAAALVVDGETGAVGRVLTAPRPAMWARRAVRRARATGDHRRR